MSVWVALLLRFAWRALRVIPAAGQDMHAPSFHRPRQLDALALELIARRVARD